MRSIPMMGIISLSIWLPPEAWIEHYDNAKAPIVVLNTEAEHPKIASFLVNFEAAAAQATQHLLDLGHTRIVYLSDYAHPVAEGQLRGIRNALSRRGHNYPEEYKVSIPMTPEGVSQGISRIMRLPSEKRPTAIFAFDDDVAIDTLNALRYYGLRVPEDISVLGFDNVPMAAHTYPPLTTVDVPKRRMGIQMVGLLEKLAQNDGAPLGSTIVDGQLVVRGSTGPAPL
jgi:LacI family transcriptional regulator